jgi:hypothetical protein
VPGGAASSQAPEADGWRRPTTLGATGWGWLIGLAANKSCWHSAAYPTTSLARARQAREDAKRLLADGIDPTSEKKRRKQEHTGTLTFRAIADEYVTKLKREGRADATITKTEWLLVFADADLGSMAIRSVDAPAVLKIGDQGERGSRRARISCNA